jgi:hypothetical protein
MMARSTNTPCKGRIQMRKTNPLHFFTFGLQRTAGPYRWVISVAWVTGQSLPVYPDQRTLPDRPVGPVGANRRHCQQRPDTEEATH